MFEVIIKKNVCYIDNIPSNEWGPDQWTKWKANTAELMQQCDRIAHKLSIVARNWKYK